MLLSNNDWRKARVRPMGRATENSHRNEGKNHMCNAYNHPPGCTCGWGGDGHSGQSFGGVGYITGCSSTDYPVAWAERDFTTPTQCPSCAADVFFIRHNGGSVWVDELGWPWPKHPCMDTDISARAFSTFAAQASSLVNPKLGIVAMAQAGTTTIEKIYHIELGDGSTIKASLQYDPPYSSMLGAMVIVSEENGVLLHPTHSQILFSYDLGPITSTGFPVAGTTPVQERLFEFICSVARRAWEAVANIRNGDEQFLSAKQEVARLISSLPPPFRQAAHYYYTSQNWEPLKRRRRYYLPPQKLTNRQANMPHGVEKIRPSEEEIRTAMAAVAKQAWDAVTGAPKEVRFDLAKAHARPLIKQLLPGLSGQVEHRMAKKGWEELRKARPASLPVSGSIASPAEPKTGSPSVNSPHMTEDRITEAIQSVAASAWAKVSHIEGPTARLKQAKQAALQLIRMLSPTIRGAVENRMTTDQWKLLRERNPRA